tara:strand:+ start:66 stop:236 length:171 start_codon:yes stop_codon:yes gene_type:complete
MTVQMIFAISYVSFVALQGMSLALGGSMEKTYSILSLLFGALTLCSYLVFLLKIMY